MDLIFNLFSLGPSNRLELTFLLNQLKNIFLKCQLFKHYNSFERTLGCGSSGLPT